MFKQEINTFRRNLILFKFMVLNEAYHKYLQMDKLFDNMKDEHSESGMNNAIEDMRRLFNFYKREYGKYPSAYTEDLKELHAKDSYPNATEHHIQNYFSLDVESWDKEIITELLAPRLEYLYLYRLIAKSFIQTKEHDTTNYEKRAKTLKDALWEGLLERDLENEDWDNELFDEHMFELDESLVIPSRFDTVNSFLSQTGDPKDGGYLLGGLYTYLAQPKAGKTTFLSNEAAAFNLKGKNVAIATFEISKHEYHERVMCCLLQIARGAWKRGLGDKEFLDRCILKRDALAEATKKDLGKTYIRRFTNANNQNDVENWVLSLERKHGIKIDAVMVDYINIMADARATGKTENTYGAIKRISEDLRASGINHGWVTLTATQVNRGGTFKEELDLTDVSESHGLSATVDGMIGIISVRNIPNQRKLQCVLSRRSGSNEIVAVSMDWDRWTIREFNNNAGEEAMKTLLE